MSNNFYNHFIQKKPTGLGWWLNYCTAKTLFKPLGLKKGMTCLEIGAGKGEFADICIKNGIKYTAIEPNNQMADELEKKGIKVYRLMVPPIPLNEKYDCVIMINVLEHFDSMQMALKVIEDCHKILKAGGKLLIAGPDYWNYQKFFFDFDYSHNYDCSYNRVSQILYDTAFKKITGFHFCVFLKGFLCFLVSGLNKHLPFIYLNNCLFPNRKILMRLSEGQSAFLRSFAVIGET